MQKLLTLLTITFVAVGIAGCASNESTPTPTTTTTQTPTPTPTPTPTVIPTVTPPVTPTVPVTNLTGPTAINITSYATNATAGGNATVCWHVDGTGVVPHTAVHWDNETHAGDNVTFADYDGGAAYPDNATSAATTGYTLPGDFCTNVPVGNETVYYRAHVMITPANGNMVSDEEHTMADNSTAST